MPSLSCMKEISHLSLQSTAMITNTYFGLFLLALPTGARLYGKYHIIFSGNAFNFLYGPVFCQYNNSTVQAWNSSNVLHEFRSPKDLKMYFKSLFLLFPTINNSH